MVNLQFDRQKLPTPPGVDPVNLLASELRMPGHILDGAKPAGRRKPDGQVQFNFGPLSAGIQHVRAGKLILLAVLPQRSGIAPDVPSLAEAGLPAGNIPLWNGLVAPPNTPRDIAARISTEVAQALKSPAIRAAYEAQGFHVVGSSPQAMADAIESAAVAWRNYVRDYDIAQE